MQAESGLDEWTKTVTDHMPHLSKPQAVVLALWSFGMVMAHSCGLTTVAGFLAALLGQKENTLRQRLREWCWNAQDKKGEPRAELEVTTCFLPLLRWVLSWWSAAERRIALVIDASTLGQLFTILAISVVYRGCAIPVAWVLVPALGKGSWRPHWLALFRSLEKSLPADWTVIVLADRGLYARWLYQEVVRIGWHPFFRIKKQGTFRPKGGTSFRSLAKMTLPVGLAWCGEVTCFRTNPLDCTLLMRWDEGHDEPWLIITDLAPEQAEAFWYAMRPWIECGFKHTKRGGWQWQNTRMTDPDRAGRLWLAMAVATLWVVSVGGEAETNLPASSFDELPESHIARRRTTKRSQPRMISCFRRGILVIIASLIAHRPLPLGRFHPEPWPTSPASSSPGFT